jgi:sRNA-binding regulator protein Hfq
VDEFELQYLTQAQEAGDTLTITLINGEQVEGQIIGFSPYTITLRLAGGEELTLNKLAIAYYRKEGAGR